MVQTWRYRIINSLKIHNRISNCLTKLRSLVDESYGGHYEDETATILYEIYG